MSSSTAAYGFVLACAVAGAVFWMIRPDLVMEMPALVLLLIVLVFSVALACGGQWYVHTRFPERFFIGHNEVGGFIIAIAGSLYSVLLGFLTVAAWQHYTEARQLVALESAASADAWHMAVGLPNSLRSRVRYDIVRYSNRIVSREWPLMRIGGIDTESDVLLMDAIAAAGTFSPKDLGASNAQNTTLQQLGVLHDVRQRRLSENAGAIVSFEWFVLLLGAICVIGFCWLFGAVNRKVHLLMTGVVAVIIASTLVLLFELQYPFRTNLRIGPDDWIAVIHHIQLMQSGPQMEMRM